MRNLEWSETWCRNDRVEDAIAEKQACYKAFKALVKSDRPDKTMVAKAKTDYSIVKTITKQTVWLVESDFERTEFAEVSPNGISILKLANQMDRSNRDVVGEMYIHDDLEKLALSDVEKLKAWIENYDRLLYVEFDWPRDLFPEVPPVEGPLPRSPPDRSAMPSRR